MSLPVRRVSRIAPSVQVSASYWCQCRNCINSVVIPLEEEINGVEGMNT
jgi:hypothetical protein